MSRIIYKYEISECIKPVIQIHSGAKFLDIQIQNEKFILWALVDTDKPIIGREFLIIGTGIEFDEYYTEPIDFGMLEHLKTIQVGSLVYHIFEDTSPF